MSSQPGLKKGGLALIINANYAKENIGRSVTLLEYVPMGSTYLYRGLPVNSHVPNGCWIVEAPGLVACWLSAGRHVEKEVLGASFINPAHLIPLGDGDGDGVPADAEDVTKPEELVHE